MGGTGNQYPYLSYFTDKFVRFPMDEYIVIPSYATLTGEDGSKTIGIKGVPGTVLDTVESPVQLLLDFGKELVGEARFILEALKPSTLTIRYGETEREASEGTLLDIGFYVTPRDDTLLESGIHSFHSKGRRAFRFLAIRLERGGCLCIHEISMATRCYPAKQRGSFSCSDTLLNRIWDISTYTMKLCMQQFYEDGVKRDGLLWLGDYRVEYLCNAYVFADAALARKCLYQFASTQRDDGAIPACAGLAGGHQHPENIEYMPGIPHSSGWPESGVDRWIILNYDTDFVSSLKEYALYSGDTATAAELLPFARRALGYVAERLETGMPQAGTDYITDSQDDAEDLDFWGSAAAMEWQLCAAARDMAWLCRKLGQKEEALHWQGESRRFRRRAQARYWCRGRGVYLDRAVSEDRHSRASLQANALAALTVGSSASGALLRRARSESNLRMPFTGFMEFYTLQAMFAGGLGGEALEEMRRYWGYMLDHGATTCWEATGVHSRKCDADFPGSSYCHGWGAGPAWLLPACVLGIQPVSPGYGQIAVNPSLGGLEWAEGVVPTPAGEIRVRWESSPKLHGCIELPDGIHGKLYTDACMRELKPGSNLI